MVLKLRYEDFQTLSRHHTRPRPAFGDEDIFEPGVSLLKRALEHRRSPVRLIGIGVTDFVPRASQLSLLERCDDRSQDLALAVDAIRRKYGFVSIQRGATFCLESHFQVESGDYLLKTSALSR